MRGYCIPRLLKRRPLLIVACGRSGTLYVCRLFHKIGIDLGHEHVGKFGCCSMYFVPNNSDFSIVNHGQKVPIHRGESKQDFKFEHIWHQVRHPLPTIDSLAKSSHIRLDSGHTRRSEYHYRELPENGVAKWKTRFTGQCTTG